MSGFAQFIVVAAVALLQPTNAMCQSNQDSAWNNRQLLALYERSGRDGWIITRSGLRWRRIKGDGGGKHPRLDDLVTIHYVGFFADGTQFDSSIERGEPATFELRGLIAGWREGLPMAGVGDTIELAIPQELAYGPQGNKVVPGRATLLFSVELLEIASRP